MKIICRDGTIIEATPERLEQFFHFRYVNHVITVTPEMSPSTLLQEIAKMNLIRFNLKQLERDGFAIFAAMPILPGDVIGYYTGDRKLLSELEETPGVDSSYCFSDPANPDFVIDAKDSGSFTRFIQHLPTARELASYYDLDPSIQGKVATANLLQVYNRENGLLEFLVTANIQANEICGYTYSMAYWEGLGILPNLYFKDGSLIPEQLYSIKKQTNLKIRLEFNLSPGKVVCFDIPRALILSASPEDSFAFPAEKLECDEDLYLTASKLKQSIKSKPKSLTIEVMLYEPDIAPLPKAAPVAASASSSPLLPMFASFDGGISDTTEQETIESSLGPPSMPPSTTSSFAFDRSPATTPSRRRDSSFGAEAGFPLPPLLPQ